MPSYREFHLHPSRVQVRKRRNIHIPVAHIALSGGGEIIILSCEMAEWESRAPFVRDY